MPGEETRCPVRSTLDEVSRVVASERIAEPRARARAEALADLLQDVSKGRGGADHFPAMVYLARRLAQGPDAEAASLGTQAETDLEAHSEVFRSHIATHVCPSGDCHVLTPAPCQMACPSGIDVSSYVSLIGANRCAEAVEIIRKDNPFPWVCGLVCTHPCEFVCVRGRVDRSIAIKDLKAFAAERAMSDRTYVNPPKAPDNGHRICILGAGPAGLTAAYFLALKGYRVTVIEALPFAGGMMMVGIPRFRLPREVIDREVAMIEDLGVEFRFRTRLGRDTTIDQLRAEGFEAFFVAVGAHACYKLAIPGEDHFPQVIGAMPFLRAVTIGDRHVPGKRVAVVGGGNVAIDAARTLIRLGCDEVTLLYRRSRSEMPANVEEVHQAEEEGVRFSFLVMPVEVMGKDRSVTGIRCLRAELSEPDDRGRRRPVPIEGSDFLVEVDAVITAIGQQTDPVGLESLGLKWTHWGTIVADTVTTSAGDDGVFAGGDVVLGPATVVEAIGAGKLAAEGIDRHVRGIPQPKMPRVPARRQRVDCSEIPATAKMGLRRQEMTFLNPDRRRVTFQQVELGFSEAQARDEARRCLRCDICKRCGTCVAVCRDKMGVDALHFGYLDFDERGVTDYPVTAERCILCGACAANCPTGAMVLEDRDGERILSLCGTVLCREKLTHCDDCGVSLGPERYLDYVGRRTETIVKPFGGRRLCQDCGRKATAEHKAGISIPKRGKS